MIDDPEGYSLEEFIAGEGHFGHDDLRLRSMSFSFVENVLKIDFDEDKGSQETLRQVRQTLSVGLDGEYRESVLSDGKYFSSGRWTAQDEIELEVRFCEALGAAMIRLSFDGPELKISVRSQIPEENSLTKRNIYELRGRLL